MIPDHAAEPECGYDGACPDQENGRVVRHFAVNFPAESRGGPRQTRHHQPAVKQTTAVGTSHQALIIALSPMLPKQPDHRHDGEHPGHDPAVHVSSPSAAAASGVIVGLERRNVGAELFQGIRQCRVRHATAA